MAWAMQWDRGVALERGEGVAHRGADPLDDVDGDEHGGARRRLARVGDRRRGCTEAEEIEAGDGVVEVRESHLHRDLAGQGSKEARWGSRWSGRNTMIVPTSRRIEAALPAPTAAAAAESRSTLS
jgi:hypothetical protein